jgi:hypothetical protein
MFSHGSSALRRSDDDLRLHLRHDSGAQPSHCSQKMIKSDPRFNGPARALISAALGVAFLCGAGATARAQGRVDVAALEQLRLAARLSAYGDRQRDPLAMIVAARIQLGAGARPSAAKVSAGYSNLSEAGARSLAPQALLVRAERYAAGRDDYLALINEQRQSGERGALRGPFVERALAPVGVVQRVLITFAKGSSAVFGIAVDEDEDLEFDVVDANGKSICRATGRGKTKQCNWVPESTGEVEISVRNRGHAANEFTFFHN